MTISQMYERNFRDRPPNECRGSAPTLNARMGTGGGNEPIVVEAPEARARMESGSEPSEAARAGGILSSGGFKPKNGPKARGIGWEIEMSPTLTTDCDACSIAIVQNLEGVE